METSSIIWLLVGGGVLLVGSLLLRVFTAGKYEIKTIDLVFIIVPLLVVALATGRLQGLDLFGVKADFSKVFAAAASREIKDQVGQPPVSSVEDLTEFIEVSPKGGINQIPRLIEAKTEAISFRLGAGVYDVEAIRRYFEALFGSSYLKFVVIENPDGTLFGVYTAADLVSYLRAAGDFAYSEFRDLLNRDDPGAREQLARLPGFIAAESAVAATITKREALERMEALDRNALPVVDDGGRFVGSVERAKVISSLLLAVTTPGGAEQP